MATPAQQAGMPNSVVVVGSDAWLKAQNKDKNQIAPGVPNSVMNEDKTQAAQSATNLANQLKDGSESKANTTLSGNSSSVATDAPASSYNTDGGGGNYYATYSSGSSGTEPTDKEKRAAATQKELTAFDRQSALNQFNQNLANLDFMDQRNRQLTNTRNQSARQQADIDRFNQQRMMMNAFNAARNAAGNALYGSGSELLANQAFDLNDYMNSSHMKTLQGNIDNNEIELQGKQDQNDYERNQLAINAEKVLADLNSSLAANLNNIHEDLYEAPTRPADETVDDSTPLDQPLSSRGFADGYLIKAAVDSGYVTPQQAGLSYDDIRNNRKATTRNDYFGRLVGKR